MNGVRRFFAANAATSDATPSEFTSDPVTSPPKPPPLQTVLPLVVGSGKQLYPAEKSPATSSPMSPGTTTAGVFSRKETPSAPKRKPAPSPDNKPLPTSPTSSSPIAKKPVRSPTSPLASKSSTTIPNGSARRRPPAGSPQLHSLDTNQKPPSPFVNTRDELLMSLLASEAIVDSRRCEVLSTEEVEELKREQQLLSSRLVAQRKKVALETKIRDAALNLQKLQTVKRLSKQTSDQIDSGNRKVDAATKELSRLMERAGDVDRKLLEHRAAVLSVSVRNLEAKISPANLNGDSVEDTTRLSGGGTTSRGVNSPISPASSMRIKFDGAHLFAGHANAILPGASRKAANSSQIAALEESLKASKEEAEDAKAMQSELQKQIKLLQLEKSDVETTLSLELQTAEQTISKLEYEVTEMDALKQTEEEWQGERTVLEGERDKLSRELEGLKKKLADLQDASATTQLASDGERRKLQGQWDLERTRLDRVNREREERMRGEMKDATEQLNAVRNILLSVLHSHKISTPSSDMTLSSLASSLGTHMTALKASLELSEHDKADVDALRRKHEEESRNGFDIRARLARELEEAKKERAEAQKESKVLQARLKEQSGQLMELANVKTSESNKSSEEYTKLISSLRSLWSVLPSVEDRASKVKSSTMPPVAPGSTLSLSDMDVRTLKSLYDAKTSFVSPTVTGDFNTEEFVKRVQALLADDRALIARLIRFAQSHDLLRNNAERAQKLAQESSKGLETYQTQVNALEERNAALSREQMEVHNKVESLQKMIEQVKQEKRALEAQSTEQVETVRNLQNANNTLSARALAFAEEAASAPNALKAKLEGQLSDLQKKLNDAQDEVERMQRSESTQRVALLDELNSLQQENGKLRDQLRAKK